MNLARISQNGQITVPVDIRKALGLQTGDKVLFLTKPNGEVVVINSSKLAIKEAQDKLSDLNISEDEILSEVMNMRYGERK